MRECGLVCYQRLLLLLLLSASFAATQSTQVTSKPSGSEPTVSTPSDLLRTPPAPSPIRRAPHTGSRHKRLNASEPVLNCSKQLADAGLSKRSLRSLQDTFLEPVLHACFDAHPYNIHQLPFAVGTKREVLEVEYSFALSAILRLGNDGSMMARANFEFSWNDRLRRWNKSQIPLEYILIPGTELWCVHMFRV